MKKKLSITIDDDVLKEFKEAAKEDGLNMSLWIENRINDYLERRESNGKYIESQHPSKHS